MFEERPAAWRILAAQFDAIFKFGGAFGTNSMTPVIGKKKNFTIGPVCSDVLNP